MAMHWKEVVQVTGVPVVLASLCCLSPAVLVLLGVASVSGAASLADTLYGEYKWYFRAVGALALAGSLFLYLTRTKGICTLDEVKRRRTEIINYIALTCVVGVFGYVVFLYGVVHYLGVWLTLWE